jgi:hypothetical protein
VNKRIVALGVTAVMALGAGTAVAGDQDLSTNQGNLASQGVYQKTNPWQKTWQDHPNAQAVADASASSDNSAGGDSLGAVGSGNGAVFSFTSGGFAGASAKNVNIGKQDVDQTANQGALQANSANEIKVAVDDTIINVLLGFGD